MVGWGGHCCWPLRAMEDIAFTSLLMIIFKKGKSSNYLSVLEGGELPC